MAQKQIILNNLLINYYIQGEGKTPIIFLHGWRSEAVIWNTTIHQLANTLEPNAYSLYALDLPGFGQSETPKNSYTLRDYAEIVKEFISTVQNPSSSIQNPESSPSIVGHSFGARIAIKLAAENPLLIQKLVLVGSGGARPWWRNISMIIAKIIKPFFLPSFMHPLRRKIYALIGAEDYVATPEITKTYLNILCEPLEPLFLRIQTPTLIIWGEKDTVTPLAYGQKMHRAIRDSRFAIMKNAGHFCFIDQPGQFIKTLMPFLTK